MEKEAQLDVMPWHLVAGSDGILRDCILVATMNGNEMQTVSLHSATPPMKEEIHGS